MRSVVFSLVVVSSSLALQMLRVAPAFADGPAAGPSCSDAYVKGQHALRDHHLKDAREALLICARAPCPTSLQPECTGWLADVDRAMPTVVFAVAGPDGRTPAAVRVSIDGVLQANALDGIAIDLDPGPHTLRMEADGYAPHAETLVAREAEKDRVVRIELTAAASAGSDANGASARAGSPSYVPAYVAGAVGAVSLGIFAGFGIAGLSLRSDLAACKPNCASERVDHVRSDWVVADVSGGVALVSLGLAAYFYLHARSNQPPRGDVSTSGRAAESASSWRVGATPATASRGGTLWLGASW